MSELYQSDDARATLRFLVSCAAQTALPARTLVGGRTIGSAYLYAFDDDQPASAQDAKQVSAALEKLVKDDLPIVKSTMAHADACAYFESAGLTRSLALLRSRVQDPVEVVKCQGAAPVRL